MSGYIGTYAAMWGYIGVCRDIGHIGFGGPGVRDFVFLATSGQMMMRLLTFLQRVVSILG